MLTQKSEVGTLHGRIQVSSTDQRVCDWIVSRCPASADGRVLAHLSISRSGLDRWDLGGRVGQDDVRGPLPAVLQGLLQSINEIACFTNPALCVHSALAADEHGRAVWVIGPSGAGKSTLIAQLSRSGLAYATDELVQVNGDDTVTGWHKWVALKGKSREVLAEFADSSDLLGPDAPWTIAPASFEAGLVNNPVTPRLVVMPQFVPGRETSLTSLSRAGTLAAIVPHVLGIRKLHEDDIDLLASVLRDTRCIRLTYGDGWDACRVLRELLQELPMRSVNEAQ